MSTVRLFVDPSAVGSVGIPKEGEIFEAEDARRLIGMGLCRRERAARKPKKPKTPAPQPATATEG